MVCSVCNGSGHIVIDDLHTKRCKCLTKNLQDKKLGPLLAKEKDIPESPLSRYCDQNMVIQYPDAQINPHLRRVLIDLGLSYNWYITTENYVLQSFLGNNPEHENILSFTHYPFLILRTGTVGYKNVALPGVFYELIQMRLIKDRVTWIITPRPIDVGCLEYSPDLVTLLKSYYTFKPGRSSKSAEEGISPFLDESNKSQKKEAVDYLRLGGGV